MNLFIEARTSINSPFIIVKAGVDYFFFKTGAGINNLFLIRIVKFLNLFID